MAKTAAAAPSPDDSFGSRVKSWPSRTKGFYGDVRAELKKVTKPSAKEVRSMTGVVLVTVALFGVYFFLVDLAFGTAMERLLNYFTTR